MLVNISTQEGRKKNVESRKNIDLLMKEELIKWRKCLFPKYCNKAILQTNTGFTFIEIAVTIAIIGILVAAVVPQWYTFVEQQRLSKVNDAILEALQEAQRDAKHDKLSYSVSFKFDSDLVPKYSIYRTPNTNSFTGVNWTPLASAGSAQVILYSNITNSSSGVPTGGSTTAVVTTPVTISFDYTGALLSTTNLGTIPQGGSQPPGLKLVVTQYLTGVNTLNSSMPQRCVVAQTLIGGMRSAQNSACN